MTDTPPDWVLIEAAKRCGAPAENEGHWLTLYKMTGSFRALCDMIQKYEQPPVDRKLLCAREAARQWEDTTYGVGWVGTRAIELYEEGFGCD